MDFIDFEQRYVVKLADAKGWIVGRIEFASLDEAKKYCREHTSDNLTLHLFDSFEGVKIDY